MIRMAFKIDEILFAACVDQSRHDPVLFFHSFTSNIMISIQISGSL